MAWDFKFDPVTGDLIDDGRGAVVLTERADTAIMLQLSSHLGEWWGDPNAGSRLHDRHAFQADPVALVEDEARRALDLLVERGRIADVDVRVEQPSAGRVNVAVTSRDVSTGEVVDTFIRSGG
jgi:phage gp46-like protein